MINVEGDYNEIVAWLDEQAKRRGGQAGVQHSNGHGIRTGDLDEYSQPIKLNVGLFSLNETHDDDDCLCLKAPVFNNVNFSFSWRYKQKPEYAGINDYKNIRF